MDKNLQRWFWIAGIVMAVVAVLALVLAQCGPGSGSSSTTTTNGINIGDVDGDVTIGGEPPTPQPTATPTPVPTPTPEPTATPAPAAASVEVISEPMPCDGTLRKVALVLGLQPGEDVDYVISPAPQETVVEGEADGDGTKDVSWSCLPGLDDGGPESAIRFVVYGKESGERVEFEVRTAMPVVDALSVEMQAPGFVCDGIERDLAVVSGFLAGESVAYELVDPTAASEELIATPADETGRKQLRWVCANEPQRDVALIVRAVQTQRSAEVTFTYIAPDRLDGDSVTLEGGSSVSCGDRSWPKSADLEAPTGLAEHMTGFTLDRMSLLSSLSCSTRSCKTEICDHPWHEWPVDINSRSGIHRRAANL